MTPPREPLFLARSSYRRRRLMDAALLLPFVAILLVLLPAIRGGALTTSGGLIYLVAVWALLVLVALAVARRLADGEPKPPPDA